ncbi:MAG: Sec-independent protein secretion pathway component [Chthonomonadaceae bacterium]|jgi:sec-independent protein translocase protein TatB|nr:Sec-independent protein secretion pathway component [Chthonomonadaceae bacterium]
MMTFAFLDSPIALGMIFVAVLLLFGPQKVPEIANQLGRALREFKRSTSELTDTFRMDTNRYEPTYDPPRYDSYGNASEPPVFASVPEEDLTHTTQPLLTSEPPRGDFAASAFADTSSEYGVSPAPADPAPAPKPITPRPADSTVPRS